MKTKWNIDGAHSGINFSIRHMVVSKVRGRFGTFSGSLDLDDADLTRSTLAVTIDAASIDTGVGQRDAVPAPLLEPACLHAVSDDALEFLG